VPSEVKDKKGEIEFRNVKFAYPTRKTARVFDGMSLKIPAGQTAALIGSSGSGKVNFVHFVVLVQCKSSHNVYFLSRF
jgi:ATP-binding cassette subfamily B (MDR/TAP) protein 1